MLTGESSGEFDILRIKDTNGIMVDILTLISAGGGLTNAQVSVLIATALASYTNTMSLKLISDYTSNIYT